MKGIFTLGLATVASAAHLRSQVQSKELAATHAGIAALAEKYDCVTGEGDLESVLDEIANKNVAAKAQLEESCDNSMTGYNTDLAARQKATKAMRVEARPNAIKAELKKIADATASFHRLDEEHVEAVSKAEAHSIKKQSEYDAHEIRYNGENGEVATYNAEVGQLVADRAAAASAYATSMENARVTLANGKAKEDGIRNNKITVAGDDKVEDDNTCAVDYAARQKIATEDEGIVSELITIRNKLDSLGERSGAVAGHQNGAFLEMTQERVQAAIQVHANYDKLLTSKNDEITQFKAACAQSIADYDAELAKKRSEANKIRSETDGIHGGVFDTEKAATDEELRIVVDRHSEDVALRTTNEAAATTDAGLKQSDFDTKEDVYNTVKATVAVERTNAENHQTDSNAAIEATRVKTISDANTFETTTIASANTARSEEETACDTAQTDRLAMIGGDEAAITEITRLVNKLDRCKAETTASSFVQVSSGRRRRRQTSTKKVKQGAEMGAEMGAESAAPLVGAGDAPVVDANGAPVVDVAADVVKAEETAEVKEPGFLEVAASKSTVSAIESMSCGAVAARLTELRATSFLETASPTTGTLNAFGDRVEQEKVHAQGNHDQCDLAAKNAFESAELAAQTLLKKETATANTNAATETKTINDAFARTTEHLNKRYSDAETPYLLAKSLSEAANIKMAQMKSELKTALSSQAEKVGAANTVHAGKMKASTEKRAQGIADDLAEAKGIEDNAVAAHKLATDTENAKCAKENQAKDGEKKHLAQFVARIKSLSAHHEGLTGNDETSMATDIINMQAAIKNERADSEVDKTTCLKISLDLHTLTVSDANKHYTAEEKKLQDANDASVTAAKTEKKAQFDAHHQREQHNEDTFRAQTTDYHRAINDRKIAMEEHVTALATQKSVMVKAHSHLIATKRSAPVAREHEIDNVMEQARVEEELASKAHCRDTDEMEMNCQEDRKILKDERETLILTRITIQKLVSVRDDTIGWDADETTTTTQAPTWERL